MTDEEFVFDRFHSMFINVIRGGSAAEFLIFTYWDNTSEGNEKYKYASIVVESGYLIIGVSGAPDISTDNSHASVKLWHKNGKPYVIGLSGNYVLTFQVNVGRDMYNHYYGYMEYIGNYNQNFFNLYLNNNVAKFNDYPYNSAVLKQNITTSRTSSIPTFQCFVKLRDVDVNNSQVLVDDIDASANVYNFTAAYENINSENIGNGTCTSLFSVYDFQIGASIGNSGEDNRILSIHFSSEEAQSSANGDIFYFSNVYPTGGIKYTKYALGDFISLGNRFRVAFNNNQLSGICGKYVLLTNWNSVDPNTVTYRRDMNGNEYVYCKQGDAWYVIYNGTPKITRKLNQIVSNADYFQNSFDISKYKVLFFAPALNSFHWRIPATPSTTGFACFAQDIQATYLNNLYIGFAINEYNQEENSSILLNPVNFHCNVLYNDFPTHLYSNIPNVYVNFYGNQIGGQQITPDPIFSYAYSTMWKTPPASKSDISKKINYDLKGLTYPVDTNGNVEYSACLFGKINKYGNVAFYLTGNKGYPLVLGNNNQNIFSYYLGTEIENFSAAFVIQGQFFGIINNQIFSMNYSGGVVNNISFVVDITGLRFVGNTPYEALFFSATNRCLYSFTGANVLNHKQLVDKISEVRNYLYNPATQTVFLITDIGVLFYGLFGQFLLEYTDITNIFLLDNGVVLSDNNGNYRYIKYYLDADDTDYTKESIRLETCFYGMNNQTVTINDCLYMRIFSEEHEEGSLKVSATTISLSGRKTEETTFKIKASDWDKITHTIYLRYQPKEQRGLGVSFSIDSPFKIASLSVGSQADAILVDKVSKGAINAPQITSNNAEW
jgi:hypothetical protein